jgi:hypothetical protein
LILIAAVVERPEEGACLGAVVAGRLEVIGNEATRRRVERYIAGLAPLAGHLQMRYAAPLLANVFDLQLAEHIPA